MSSTSWSRRTLLSDGVIFARLCPRVKENTPERSILSESEWVGAQARYEDRERDG